MNRREWTPLAVGVGLLVATSCSAVDSRSLSFRVSEVGSSPASSDDDPSNGTAGEGPAQGGQTGASGGAGSSGEPAGSGEPGGAATASGGETQLAAGAPNGSAGSGDNVGGTEVGGSGGSGGSDPEPGSFPCGDVNHNSVDDCTETLVTNSRFDVNASAWDAEGSLEQLWKAEDARGGNASGSVSLLYQAAVASGTGNTALGAHQCVLAWGGDAFVLGARVLIEGGQGSGEAGLNMIFYGNDGCEGTIMGGHNVALTSETDKWTVVLGQLVVPAGTRSARVRLMLSKPFAEPSFGARFDDVLVVKL